MIDSRSWSVNGSCAHNCSTSNQSKSRNRRSSRDNNSATSSTSTFCSHGICWGHRVVRPRRRATTAPYADEGMSGMASPYARCLHGPGGTFTRHEVPALADRIWKLRHQYTSYDARYLVLAEALEVPL